MPVLIVYATSDGQTRRIARRMADALERDNLSVTLIDAAVSGLDLLNFDGFDAALLLGSVRMGRRQRALVDFVRNHRVELDAIPNAFVSVSLSAARIKGKPSARREVEKTFQDFTSRTGWRPDAQIPVAGALPYTKYTVGVRLVMKFISWATGGETDTSRDYEYTDWDAVEDFAHRFASALLHRAVATAAQAEIELH